MAQVKVKWKNGVVENATLDRDLLDTPPAVVKAMTATQQKWVNVICHAQVTICHAWVTLICHA